MALPCPPNSQSVPSPTLVSGLSLPSQPSANSAPTKLGRKRKIDDSRCAANSVSSPPTCRLPQPARRSQQVVSARLRGPSISIHPVQGLIPPPPESSLVVPSQVKLQSSVPFSASPRPPLGGKFPPPAGLNPKGRPPRLNLISSWITSKVTATSIFASVS